MGQTPNQFGVCLRKNKYDFFKVYVGAVEGIPFLTVRKGNSFVGGILFMGGSPLAVYFSFGLFRSHINRATMHHSCMKESSGRIRALSGDTHPDLNSPFRKKQNN